MTCGCTNDAMGNWVLSEKCLQEEHERWAKICSFDWSGSPELTARISKALEQANRGETYDLGEFSQYLEDEDE